MRTHMTRGRDEDSYFHRLLARMDDWPRSWKGFDADEPIGQGLVRQMRPFIEYLHAQGLTSETLRRHSESLWVIGGEIIRDVNDDDDLRQCDPKHLLWHAVEAGEAPLARGATEQDQRQFDATARKLRNFLTTAS